MAERIPDLDLRTVPHGTRPRYPWHEWADGTCWKLAAGEDFTATLENFRRAVHNRAHRNGWLAITRQDGPKHLLVQFVRPGDPEPAEPGSD
jgi:hypothetical protein